MEKTEEKKKITSNIIRKYGVLKTFPYEGWNLELNLVSWNNQEPKLDLRKWSSDHSKCSKGFTFSPDDANDLLAALKKYFEYLKEK